MLEAAGEEWYRFPSSFFLPEVEARTCTVGTTESIGTTKPHVRPPTLACD